ncbi:MAG: oligoendopeptidase F [Lachnospiraceae bacterium]|nr:oligoendopeptidase F [Lachnospiraceae bacterium]
MPETKIWKREEVPEAFTWDLSVLYKSDEDWSAALGNADRFFPRIEALKGRLGESSADLLAFLKLSDELEDEAERLYTYAMLKGDQDTSNAKYQGVRGKVGSFMVKLSSSLAFADPEIMAIPEETLNRFFEECPEIGVYRRPLTQIRRKAAHILSPAEEALLSAAGDFAHAPQNINSMLQNADLKWPDVTDAEGNAHPLTNGSLVPLLESPDQEFRKKVFQTYYEGLRAHKNTIAAAFNGQFKQLKFYASARKYGSTLEASLDRTEVPTAVYHNLIQAVHDNFAPMYRYVALRKKMLGVDELHMYDVYTPIVKDSAKTIPFDEAKKTVLKALSVLGKDYTDILEEGFNHRWIDVYENVGKRSGAYSTGSLLPHPYVLLNQKDTLDSMFTLAHEMGHALHSYHSTKNQPICTANYVIFVAEVASTCNEVLLMKHLLKETSDPTERAYLINHFLDSFKGTLYRQTMFAEFELMMGKMAEADETLTADALSAKYLELNKLYFGPDMISDDEIALEWARIPHFFYNYYVFQYATGFSAAVAIANRILEEGEPAVRDYKKFLSSGGSADPISLLKIAGVDMGSPEPVNSALKLFGELVGELEAIADRQ